MVRFNGNEVNEGMVFRIRFQHLAPDTGNIEALATVVDEHIAIANDNGRPVAIMRSSSGTAVLDAGIFPPAQIGDNFEIERVPESDETEECRKFAFEHLDVIEERYRTDS